MSSRDREIERGKKIVQGAIKYREGPFTLTDGDYRTLGKYDFASIPILLDDDPSEVFDARMELGDMSGALVEIIMKLAVAVSHLESTAPDDAIRLKDFEVKAMDTLNSIEWKIKELREAKS